MSTGQSPGPGFAGYVVEVESYTTLRAAVYVSASRLLRYGALALAEDVAHGKRYLALVEDVAEKAPIPHIDTEALEALYQALRRRGAEYNDLNKVLQSLLSPTQGLIKWHSVKTLRLRLLGEITDAGLQLPEKPPSPMSIVREPDHGLLAALVSRGLDQRGLYLGELAYNPGVGIRLDPRRLNTHLAVIGQTGAGKSETVKRLTAEYSWRKHLFSAGGGVLVLDVSGEYTGYPYTKPDTVPLLDAILEPEVFTDIDTQWLHKAPKTILVPLDLATLPMHRSAEERYAAELGALLAHLASRHPGTRVAGLLYGRHHIYEVEPRQVTPVSRGRAAALLRGNDVLLVVAAPLPDTLTVAQVYELAGTRSEYFTLAVAEAADILGVLDVESLATVTGLGWLVSAAWRLYQSHRQRTQQGQGGAASRAAAELQSAVATLVDRLPASQNPATEAARLLEARGIRGFTSVRAVLNLLALPKLLRDPAAEPGDPEVLAHALSTTDYPVPGLTWGNYLRRYVEHAARELLSHQWNTVMSIVRGFKRVSRMVSPFLDAGQYRLLAHRLHMGFTIVQLAPPSRGDTSVHVARLLDELFAAAVESYDPGNRTLIVVEEAHNLAPSSEDKASKRALLRIAREGRKWGLSLVLVTQRPGFIDQDILSQAASLIALRITNPDDLSGLKRSVESVSQEMINRLPDLDPGQALVSGPALPERRIPLLARVEKLKPKQP